jgi:excinuclease UvrABC ATPase subunit
MIMICPECNGRGESIYYVETDRDENTVTVEKRKGICRTCNGSGEQPMTNADRIRAWNDHELAETIANFVSEIDNGDVRYSDDQNDWLKWLQQPVEDERWLRKNWIN